MNTLSTDRATYHVRGNSLKAIRSAGMLGGPAFRTVLDNDYAGSGTAYEESDYIFSGRTPRDDSEEQVAVTNRANLKRFRNNVAAVLMASTLISCEVSTAAGLPEVQQFTRETVLPVEQQDVENFLEPLVFVWDEEKYIVSEAIRNYLAVFDADH